MKLPSNIFLYHRFRFVILLSWLLLRNSDCTSLRAAISNIGEGSLLNMSFDLIGLSCYIEIKQQDGTSSDLSAVRKSQKTTLPISLTFGRRVVTIRSPIGCKCRHALRAKHRARRPDRPD